MPRPLMKDSGSSNSWLARAGLQLSEWFEQWFPDAFALAVVAVAIVFTASVAIGNSPIQAASWFGAGADQYTIFPNLGRFASADVGFLA